VKGLGRRRRPYCGRWRKVKTSNSIPFGDSADHVEADGGEATAAVAPWSGFDVTPAAVYVVVATLVSQARKLLDGTNRR